MTVPRLFVLCVGFLSAVLHAEDTLILVSDPYPPYVIDAKERQGFVTDIAIRAFALKGIKAIYQNVPFMRAQQGVEAGQYHAILSIAKSARAKLVYPEETLGTFRDTFFTHKDNPWQWQGSLRDLEKETLGFIAGYQIGKGFGLMNYIESNEENTHRVQIVSGDDALQKNLRKLINGRVTVLVDDEMVVRYTASRLGISDKIKASGSPQRIFINYVSIGFGANDKNSQKYARAYDEGVRELRASGELQKIIEYYGLITLD